MVRLHHHVSHANQAIPSWVPDFMESTLWTLLCHAWFLNCQEHEGGFKSLSFGIICYLGINDRTEDPCLCESCPLECPVGLVPGVWCTVGLKFHFLRFSYLEGLGTRPGREGWLPSQWGNFSFPSHRRCSLSSSQSHSGSPVLCFSPEALTSSEMRKHST